MPSENVVAETKPNRASYRAFVWFLLVLGILTGLGSVLWLVAGAGIYGSPISSNAFRVDDKGYTDYWSFWMLFVVMTGPFALFPAALLERFRPGHGAIAMIFASLVVAEAGIQSSKAFWGFASDNAQVVIFCIALPMLLFATNLVLLRLGPLSRKQRWGGCVGLCLLAALVTVRYQMVRQHWERVCPASKQTNVMPTPTILICQPGNRPQPS
jgi:hypothetical protein